MTDDRQQFDHHHFILYHPKTLYASKRDHNNNHYIKDLAILIQDSQANFIPQIQPQRLHFFST